MKQMGETYGYARVSTEDQELGLQVSALRDAGVADVNIVREKASGKAGSDRPLYAGLLAKLERGDKLIVWKVDRLGRGAIDALQVAQDLQARGVNIVITTLGADLATPAGKLVFGVLAQIAEFERDQIRERVNAGIADAKRRGKHCGRKPRLRPHQQEEAARLHRQENKTLGAIAALFGVGVTVIHRAINGEERAR
jgi:DNA invertase Pin-like site-specific DNA recombinase